MALVLLLFVFCGVDGGPPLRPPMVHLRGLGPIHGSVSDFSRSVAVFRGVPYAEPPVGDLRWRETQPLSGGWGPRPRSAKEFGNACMALGAEQSMSEDCLYLNFAVPRRALVRNGRKLPILMYIHGGSYRNGASTNQPIDSIVAKRRRAHTRADAWPLIAVNINYRLNIFGFLGAESLRGRTLNGATGNYGMDDQRMAMKWLHQHAASFGGDANQLTIFGESAGGNAVLNHLAQPVSFGLYAQAIIESGGYIANVPMADADSSYRQLVNATSCHKCYDSRCADEELQCLLAKSAEELRAVVIDADGAIVVTGPVLDGVILTATPQVLLKQGEYNRDVPVIVGSNSDEMGYFLADGTELPTNLTEEVFNLILPGLLPMLSNDGIDEVKQLYAPNAYEYPEDLGRYSTWWWRVMRMATEGAISDLGACSARRIARSLVAGGSPGVFAYHFSHPTQIVEPDININNYTVPGTEPGNSMAPHASEVPYVFGYTEVLSPEDVGVARLMSAQWREFAIRGHPRGIWPNFGPSDETLLQLDSRNRGGTRRVRNLRQATCDFWDRQAESMSADVWGVWHGKKALDILV